MVTDKRAYIGYCRTDYLDDDVTIITSTDWIPSDETTSISVTVTQESVTFTVNGKNQYYDYERFSRIIELEEMRQGWLKPIKQLRPYREIKYINYNLPRSRLPRKIKIDLAA